MHLHRHQAHGPHNCQIYNSYLLGFSFSCNLTGEAVQGWVGGQEQCLSFGGASQPLPNNKGGGGFDPEGATQKICGKEV